MTAGVMAHAPVAAASTPKGFEPPTALVITEASTADLNGDGDVLDAVVHVVDPATGATINLGLAVPLVCDPAGPPGFCSPVQPVGGETIAAFLASEPAQGAIDLNADGDAIDDVLFVYDGRRGEVRSTTLAVAHGVRRSVSFIRFPIAPVVFGDAVVFLVAEAEQGRNDVNGDGDVTDAIVYLVAPHSRRILNVGLAAPNTGFFASPLLMASEGDGQFVDVLIGESEQQQDLDGDGDEADVVTMQVQVQSGKARLAR